MRLRETTEISIRSNYPQVSLHIASSFHFYTMDTHLKNVVVCTAGDLAHDANNEQWSVGNIRKWLEARGGECVEVMSEKVTHLLCSEAAFKAKKDKGNVPTFLIRMCLLYTTDKI